MCLLGDLAASKVEMHVLVLRWLRPSAPLSLAATAPLSLRFRALRFVVFFFLFGVLVSGLRPRIQGTRIHYGKNKGYSNGL